MSTITEAEFQQLCADIYTDRRQIYAFNPSMSRRDALLWMLTGSLLSLLSIPILEQPSTYGSSPDPFGDAIREILLRHARPAFDPQKHIDELTRRVEAEG